MSTAEPSTTDSSLAIEYGYCDFTCYINTSHTIHNFDPKMLKRPCDGRADREGRAEGTKSGMLLGVTVGSDPSPILEHWAVLDSFFPYLRVPCFLLPAPVSQRQVLTPTDFVREENFLIPTFWSHKGGGR